MYLRGCICDLCWRVADEVHQAREKLTNKNHGATPKTFAGRSIDSLIQRDLYQRNRRIALA
jgi:hypothetical protein